jgi:nicotinate-nucleotide adenylyltransferase
LKTPILEISSTFIRQCVKEGHDVRHFMPEKAFHYMDENRFYCLNF